MLQKVAVITGASRGIGFELSLLLAEAGYLVYNLSRNRAKTDALTPKQKALLVDVRFIACDVSQSEQVKQAIQQIVAITQRLDLVVNNAGYGIAGSIEASSIADIDQQLQVNLHAAFYLAQASLGFLRTTKGRLIFVSSVAGAIPIPFQTTYSVSKAGLISLALALDNELRGTGARALALMPGDVRTTFTEHRKTTDLNAENACYKERFLASLRRMEQDERNGKPAKHIAQAIFNLSQSRKPKVLTAVDFKYKLFVCLYRFLPVKLASWIIGLLYA